MKRPANITFLTPEENECLEHLLSAQDIFDKICEESPQSSSDTYNFGHYLDAARNAILIRGVRRMDPDNLLVKHSSGPVITPTMIEHVRSTENSSYGGEFADILDKLNRGENPTPPERVI